MNQSRSQQNASKTSAILPEVPLEEPLPRIFVDAVINRERSASSSRERLTQPVSDDQTGANSDEIELRVLSFNEREPILLRNPGIERLEAGTSADGQRRWKAHHQDIHGSKWFKALLCLIFVAIVSAACLLFSLFAKSVDIFAFYHGVFFWLWCVLPLVGIVFLWVPCGIFFSKVFRTS